jgi:hypothetical protein
VLILDTQVYEKDRRSGTLTPTSNPPHAGRWNQNSRGLPAVLLDFTDDDPDYEEKMARVREVAGVTSFVANGLLVRTALEEDGEHLGYYQLVTSMAYLHGDYLTLAASQRAADEESEVRRAAQEEQDARDAEAFERLKARLEHLGITGTYLRSHQQIGNLYLDGVTRLVDLAEAGDTDA